jgi:hypothetical protein
MDNEAKPLVSDAIFSLQIREEKKRKRGSETSQGGFSFGFLYPVNYIVRAGK